MTLQMSYLKLQLQCCESSANTPPLNSIPLQNMWDKVHLNTTSSCLKTNVKGEKTPTPAHDLSENQLDGRV